MKTATCTAPVNIAVIKYWGKRDEELILPINDSLSVTLSQDQLCAKTTVMASSEFTEDRMWLNGKEESMSNKRLQNVLKEVKRLALLKRTNDGDCKTLDLVGCHVHICSENNFPTAAGLASSAAGYACLVYTLAQLYGVTGNISGLARIGSGSACRSLNGGFVAWRMGSLDSGMDSLAEQVADQSHWPELKVLILVVSAEKKAVGSTAGMGTSVATSELLDYRAKNIVSKRMSEMETAIKNRDFEAFAKLTMQDSNQFHGTCLDTYPPIFYMNDISRRIVNMVHAYNTHCGATKVAYTFDAGPNACLYLLEDSVSEVASLTKHYFPAREGSLEVKGIPVKDSLNQAFVDSYKLEPAPGGLQYIISTEVGDDPRILPDSESLLRNDGLPKSLIK